MELEWQEVLKKYPKLVYKEFYWEKRGDHGPAKYDVSFENVEQSLQAWVGLDFVPKAGAENGTNLTQHDSAASADCSHRFQMEESLVF